MFGLRFTGSDVDGGDRGDGGQDMAGPDRQSVRQRRSYISRYQSGFGVVVYPPSVYATVFPS